MFFLLFGVARVQTSKWCCEMNTPIYSAAVLYHTEYLFSIFECNPPSFTVHLYMYTDAASPEPYSGHRARFLCAILWLAATYVLGDVYSAQLTSQLARPAREAPISIKQYF